MNSPRESLLDWTNIPPTDRSRVWKLTKGQVHVTDETNASRTMLFNIHTRDWDDELLQALHVPRSMLPAAKSSSEVYGEASGGTLTGIPIAGIAGELFHFQHVFRGDAVLLAARLDDREHRFHPRVRSRCSEDPDRLLGSRVLF